MVKKEGQIMFLRRLAGCCRRVLAIALVAVLLVAACSPASEEEEGDGAPPSGAGAEVPGSLVSPPSAPGVAGTVPGSVSSVAGQRALDALGEVFTGEELDVLEEVFTEGELVDLAGQFSGGELVGVLGLGGSVWGGVFERAVEFRDTAGEDMSRAVPSSRFEALEMAWAAFEVLPDDELRAHLFSQRLSLEDSDFLGIDANDVSSPTGAFCWVVLRLRSIMPNEWEMSLWGESVFTSDWYIDILTLWVLERMAADRGLELEREAEPIRFNDSLRRFLLEVTAPEFKGVVLAEGLPAALKPVAERLYDYFEGLLELPVYRARPTLAELSAHPGLAGMTGEDVRRVWPEVLEIELSGDDYDEYARLYGLLEEGEVRELLNSECKQRTAREMNERNCPSPVAEAIPDMCAIPEDYPKYLGTDYQGTDCLFTCPEDDEQVFLAEPFEGFISVSAGLNYACGVRPSGVAWCWNWWDSSQGSRGKQGHHFSTRSDWRVRSVEAGLRLGFRSFSCHILHGGELLCAGERMPLGDVEPPAGEFGEVSVGVEHVCALRVAGGLVCWGIDPASAKVSPPAGEFVSVDAGWDGDVHLPEGDMLDDGGLSCGLRVDAVVECWGEERLSFGGGSVRGDEFAGVAVGRSGRVCLLRTDGVIHCGEDRVYGSDYPPGSGFTQVSVGGLNHVCGLRAGGAVECWEPSGEFLGSIPGPFTDLDVGYTYAEIPYACGLLADGRILCWDLVEEVFNWAADGLEKYPQPICVPQLIPVGYLCWNGDSEPPSEIDDRYVKESPILLPHSGSVLYPDRDSG